MGKFSRKSIVASNYRREVAALYLEGRAQAEIGEKLKIAQSTIGLDLLCIDAASRESCVMDLNTRQIVELQKLDQLEHEAWAAWERSQIPSQQARVKGGTSKQDAERVVKNQIGDVLLGTLNFRRHLKWFGACKRGADDSSAEFYAKLPPWLERDIPPT